MHNPSLSKKWAPNGNKSGRLKSQKHPSIYVHLETQMKNLNLHSTCHILNELHFSSALISACPNPHKRETQRYSRPVLVWSQPTPKGAAQQDIHTPSWLRCGVSHCPVWVYSTAHNIHWWKTILGRGWVSNDKGPTTHSWAKWRILPWGFPVSTGPAQALLRERNSRYPRDTCSSTKYSCPAATPGSSATDFVRTGN